MSTKPVFISYSRKDTDFVNVFIEKLRAAGVNLWLDQNIKLGGRWDNSIETALESCDDVLIIASENSMNSNNVLDEVAYALEENKRVIPIRIEDCEMNFRLRRIQHLDYFKDEEGSFKRLLSALDKEPAPIEKPPLKSDEPSVPLKPKEDLKPPVKEKKGKPILTFVIVFILGFAGTYFAMDYFKSDQTVIAKPEIKTEIQEEKDSIPQVVKPVIPTDQEDWDNIPDEAEQSIYEEHLASYQDCTHKELAGQIIKDLKEIEFETTTYLRAIELNDVDSYLNYIEDFGRNSLNYNDAIEQLIVLFDKQGYVQYSESSGNAYFEIFDDVTRVVPKEKDLIYALRKRNIRAGKIGAPNYDKVVYVTDVDEAFIVLEVELVGSAYWVKIAY